MKRKRVVVDTNVLISAALGNGFSSKIMTLFEQEDSEFEISYSDEIIAEYKRVSTYNRILRKYPQFGIKVNEIIFKLTKGGKQHVTKAIFNLIKDPSDNKFLDLAYTCNADYLITGNHLDFTITEFYQTKIVSPKQFWEAYETGSL